MNPLPDRVWRGGTHVIWILVTSLAHAIVALMAVWGIHIGPFAATEGSPGAQAQVAADFNAPSEPVTP